MLCAFALLLYTPLAYVTDRWVYQRAQRASSSSRADDRPLLHRRPLQENCWIVARGGAGAVVIDPGDEAERLIEALEDGITVEAILLTHTHFDHVGAVAALARHTGAPVYCPGSRSPSSQDINSYLVPGLRAVRARTTPRRRSRAASGSSSPGSTSTSSSRPATARATSASASPSTSSCCSGDVLFQGSIGRTDLPGGDHATLMSSIARC